MILGNGLYDRRAAWRNMNKIPLLKRDRKNDTLKVLTSDVMLYGELLCLFLVFVGWEGVCGPDKVRWMRDYNVFLFFSNPNY